MLAAGAAPLAVVVVPPEAPVAEWSQAFGLVDLDVGIEPPAGPAVWVERSTDGWRVRVRDSMGAVRSMPVDRPATQGDRERVAFLASSLLQPVVAVPLPPLPKRPARRPAKVEAAVETEPVVQVPPAPLAPALAWRRVRSPWLPSGRQWAPPLSNAPRAFGAVGVEATFRGGTRPLVGPALWGGLPLAEHLDVIGGIHLGLPAALTPPEAQRNVQGVRLWAAGHVTWQRWSAGPGVGMSWRRFSEEGRTVLATWIPDLHLAGMVRLPMRNLSLRVRAQLGWDLVPVDLVVGEGAPERRPPLHGALGVTVGTRRRPAVSATVRR